MKPTLITQVLFMMIAVVLLSAGVLFLIKTGVLIPKEHDVQILNAEFFPHNEDIALRVDLCGSVDEFLHCLDKKTAFEPGDIIYVRVEGKDIQKRLYHFTLPNGDVSTLQRSGAADIVIDAFDAGDAGTYQGSLQVETLGGSKEQSFSFAVEEYYVDEYEGWEQLE